MKKLEFETVLDVLGINNKCINEDNIDVYLWHSYKGYKISFNNGIAEIKGHFPYEFVQTFKNKYQEDFYSVVDNDKSENINFVDGFNIKTKEGLLVLIFELQKYYLLEKIDDKIKNDELYCKLHNEVLGWPDWKKKAYNDFAVSKYAEKLNIKKR